MIYAYVILFIRRFDSQQRADELLQRVQKVAEEDISLLSGYSCWPCPHQKDIQDNTDSHKIVLHATGGFVMLWLTLLVCSNFETL